MPRTVEAIFEGGVLKPISPLNRKYVTGGNRIYIAPFPVKTI